jgi:hypothetical protein
MPGGGLPMEPILSEVRAIGRTALGPPVPEISRVDAMRAVWQDADFESIETRKITVQRTFADVDDFWTTNTLAGTIRTTVAALTENEVAAVKDRLRATLPTDASGRITRISFANAVKGRVPE